MGRKGHGQQLIAEVLRKSAEGMSTAELCRKYGITERTFYRWKLRQNQGGDEARVLKQIEEENQLLKALVAELILENRTLKGELETGRNAGKARRSNDVRVQ